MITAEEKAQIIKIVMKNGKGFRATKPKVDRNDPITGRTAYVWRMVGFQISKNSVHWCMPVCADMDLEDADWADRKVVTKALDEIVKEIVDEVPPALRHGINRWGRAMGMI